MSSLKPAAVPLMDSGKALARSGELLIDVTGALDTYGGGLSSAGAQLRNAGDCIAQAAASVRFKTAAELVVDELRESGTCLGAAAQLMQRAVEEAEQDNQLELSKIIASTISPLSSCGALLEEAGYTVLRKEPPPITGQTLQLAANELELVSLKLPSLLPGNDDAKLSSQRLLYAAQQMRKAGESLLIKSNNDGRKSPKAWIKAGGGM